MPLLLLLDPGAAPCFHLLLNNDDQYLDIAPLLHAGLLEHLTISKELLAC